MSLHALPIEAWVSHPGLCHVWPDRIVPLIRMTA